MLWENLVEQVGKASPFAKTYLIEAHPVSLVRNVLTIGLDPEFSDHLALLDNPKNRTLIQTKLEEAGIGQAQVKVILSELPADKPRRTAGPAAPPIEAPSPKQAPPPVRSSAMPAAAVEKAISPKPLALGQDDFKSDPLIRQALEIFRGQIVDVRQ